MGGGREGRGNTRGNNGLCRLVKEKGSVKRGTQRGNFLGRGRAFSGTSYAGRIGQRFYDVGSGE